MSLYAKPPKISLNINIVMCNHFTDNNILEIFDCVVTEIYLLSLITVKISCQLYTV